MWGSDRRFQFVAEGFSVLRRMPALPSARDFLQPGESYTIPLVGLSGVFASGPNGRSHRAV